jgi:hypothetical protein
VTFDITRIKGIKNMLFGGEGIFLGELKGPGRIWLHSMAVSHLAHRIGEYLPGREEGGTAAGGAAGLVGGIIGSALGGGRNDRRKRAGRVPVVLERHAYQQTHLIITTQSHVRDPSGRTT